MTIIARRQRFQITIALGGLLATSLLVAAPAHGNTINVNAFGDLAPNQDGICTLREAVINANNNNQSGSTDCLPGSGTDTIILPGPATVTLGSPLPIISDHLTVDGGGTVTISGNGAVAIFKLGFSKTLNLVGLTIANGVCDNFCNNGNGGAGVYTDDGATTLNITSCTFSNNSALFGGAAISAFGAVTITNSTFTGNVVTTNGAAILNTGAGPLKVSNSTFSGNSAGGAGGAIYNSGTSSATISNSTITDNFASVGGGIANTSTLSVINSTLWNNRASSNAGGIYTNGSTNLANTIVAGSTAGDCYKGTSATVTGKNNLIPDGITNCGFTNGVNGNIIGSNPNLGRARIEWRHDLDDDLAERLAGARRRRPDNLRRQPRERRRPARRGAPAGCQRRRHSDLRHRRGGDGRAR